MSSKGNKNNAKRKLRMKNKNGQNRLNEGNGPEQRTKVNKFKQRIVWDPDIPKGGCTLIRCKSVNAL